MRTRVVPTLIALAVVGFPTLVAAPAPADETWLRPVSGRVVRPFRAPLTRYGPGHLGVDFAAVPGTPVRAAGGGTVVFAGVVANARHVVVRHAGGLRTSYSFLASIRVRRGEVVERGDVVGTSGGRGRNHEPVVSHLGLRIGDVFVDPMVLFAPAGLADRVHLAPIAADSGGSSNGWRFEERRALLGMLARSAPARPEARLAPDEPGRGPLH